MQNLLYLCIRSIKSSHLRMDSPTEQLESRWSVRCGRIIHFKTFQFMQQHIYYIRYALRFADMQIPELVSVFNAQVQNRGWSSMRAYHDQALIDELQRRAVDISAVYDGKAICFAHPVRYDLPDNKLIAIG